MKTDDLARLKADLEALGWTPMELSRRVVVHSNTAYHWLDGTRRIPGAVLAYVRLLVGMKGLTDDGGRKK